MKPWPIKPLSNVATVIRGVSFDKSQFSDRSKPNSVPVLRAGNIQDTLLTDSDLIYVPEELVSEGQRMRQGDLAMCMSSGSPAIVGKTAHLESNWNGSVGAFCAIVRFNEKLHHRFGSYWFRSPAFFQWRDSRVQGANIQNLRRTELEAISIPVPPLREQEQIVKLLDESNELRKLRALADRRTAEFIPDLFHEMFDGNKFKLTRVADLTSIVTSGSTPRGGEEIYVSKGPYFIRSQNVRMNWLDLSDAACLPAEIHREMSRTKVATGDVLLNITGASIGRVAWVDKLDREANVSQHVCLIRPKPELLTSAYLSVFISLPATQRLILQVQAGASRQALNHQQVRAFEIPVPPFPLQKEFAQRVREIRELESAQAQSRARLDALFASLLDKAFKGEL
jgi:type I restriction enzyme, S subunit